MINWIHRDKQHPGANNKWVLVWDGTRIYPCLWVAPDFGIGRITANVHFGYFKDMEMGCYADNVTHWAELPLDHNQSLSPETEAPVMYKNVKEVRQLTDKFLADLRNKFPDMEWRVDVFSKLDEEEEREFYSVESSIEG